MPNYTTGSIKCFSASLAAFDRAERFAGCVAHVLVGVATGRYKPPAACRWMCIVVMMFAVTAAGLVSPSFGETRRLTLAERVAMKRTATQGPVEIRYELPESAYVTLVIEDEDGKRIRNLIGDAFRPAGENVDYWDGADDEAYLVTPGTYRVRGLYHQELLPVFQFAFGTPADPPWETIDGKGAWLSDMNAAEAAAADDERVYLAAPYAHDGSAVMAINYDGKKQWGIKANYHGNSGTALAVDEKGKYLYVGVDAFRKKDFDRLMLYRVDKKTGDYVPFPDGEIYHAVGRYDRLLFPPPRLPGDWIAAGDHNPVWARTSLLGMAYRAGTLYMSSYWQDKILVIDAEKGETFAEIPVRRPAGLAIDAQGRLLAVSEKQVVVVDQEANTTRTLIRAQEGALQAPMSLAADDQGNIYVSDWGREMCVKVYSSDGNYLRQVGKRGGRPWVGTWDPHGMLLPNGLAVDRRGRLWVAEKDITPKRISVWSPNGEFDKEFIGPAMYKNLSSFLNAHDPTKAILTLCELELDWETGSWRPLSTIWRSMQKTALFGPRHEQHGNYRIIRVDGREFLISSTRWVSISERKGDRFHPLVALGNVEETVWRIQENNHGPSEPRRVIPFLDDHRTPSDRRWIIEEPNLVRFYPSATTNFYWADQNGDGAVQEGELTFFEAPGTLMPWDFFWSNPVSENLTIYAYSPVGGGREIIWRLPRTGWTSCGAPLHEPEKAEILVDRPRKRSPGANASASWVFSDEQVLSGEVPMALFSSEGKVRWTYPNDWAGGGSHHAPAARPGLVIGPIFTLGEADLGGDVGTIFALRGDLGEDYLFTLDGLYIGNLFRDIRSGAEAFPAKAERGAVLKDVFTAGGGEPFGGTLIQHPDTGKVYVTTGDRAPCICEVRGLETIRRLPGGKFEFTLPQYQEAEKLLAARVTETVVTEFKIARMKQKPQIDGNIDEWNTPSVARIYLDPMHAADVRAAYDDENLYLSYQVDDKMLFANSGLDWTLMFKTGSAVEFQIGVNAEARRDRHEPVVGDQRIIIASHQGKLTAVLYKFVVANTAEPRTFSSPVGTTEVDVVRRIDAADIAISKGDGRYTLEATIPLQAIEFHPRPGQKLSGDFGVIWSDALGQNNTARCYWANKTAGIVTDLFSEARIEPNKWGEFQVE